MMKKLFFLAAAAIVALCAVRAQNPIIRTMYTADPAPLVHRDTLFVFVGHDEDDAPARTFLMREYRLFSTVDMVNWTDHGAALRTGEIDWSVGDASAAQVIERNGKFYYYVSTQNNTPGAGGVSVGVLVADNIRGPYRDPLGRALVTNQMTPQARHSWDDLDPTVFIDDDGHAYLFWGNNACYWVRLGEDMISLDGPIHALDVRDESIFGPDFEEAPWVYKRGGTYYMIYASGLPESIHYATAPEPDGPWKYRGVVMPRQGGIGTNHPGVVDYRGRSYFFYHNDFLPGGHDHRRSVAVEEFAYNPDGTIPLMTMTEGVARSIAPLDPYRRVEAETMALSQGVKTAGGYGVDRGGNCVREEVCVTSIHDGDYIRVREVDFGAEGASTFTARTSSRWFGGEIELRLDTTDGPVIGTLRAPYTREWENWSIDSAPVTGATGVHDLYFVFRGGAPHELLRFDHWSFSE
ncbi:MAG: glycoside hydrolase family 43 protein [Alistipes sp.]|jgi:hypothetical protein|nr:glycoside hydrolase family 43 protein [Alistipes sp.]